MMQEKWFVHFQGHTMGPFSTEDIKTSIQKKEIGKQDKIASTEKKMWQTVEAIPEFRDFFLPPLAPSFSIPIPPPLIWKKNEKDGKHSYRSSCAFPGKSTHRQTRENG